MKKLKKRNNSKRNSVQKFANCVCAGIHCTSAELNASQYAAARQYSNRSGGPEPW